MTTVIAIRNKGIGVSIIASDTQGTSLGWCRTVGEKFTKLYSGWYIGWSGSAAFSQAVVKALKAKVYQNKSAQPKHTKSGGEMLADRIRDVSLRVAAELKCQEESEDGSIPLLTPSDFIILSNKAGIWTVASDGYTERHKSYAVIGSGRIIVRSIMDYLSYRLDSSEHPEHSLSIGEMRFRVAGLLHAASSQDTYSSGITIKTVK